jgi:hypothetical protein
MASNRLTPRLKRESQLFVVLHPAAATPRHPRSKPSKRRATTSPLCAGSPDRSESSYTALHRLHFGNTMLLVSDQFFPKRLARAHFVVPRRMMEAELVFIRHRIATPELLRHRVRVLPHGLRTVSGSRHTNACSVRAVIVVRIPLRATKLQNPRCKTVVMPRAHQVGQLQRRLEDEFRRQLNLTGAAGACDRAEAGRVDVVVWREEMRAV